MTSGRFPGNPRGRPSWSAGKHPEGLTSLGCPGSRLPEGCSLGAWEGHRWAGRCTLPRLHTPDLAPRTHDRARKPGPRQHVAPPMRAHGAGGRRGCGSALQRPGPAVVGLPVLWEDRGQRPKPLQVWALPQTPGSTVRHSTCRPHHAAVTERAGVRVPSIRSLPVRLLMSRDGWVYNSLCPSGLAAQEWC